MTRRSFRFGGAVMLLLVLGAFIQSDGKKDKIIIWNQAYKLQWEDFQAKPDESSPQNALTFFQIETSIHMIAADYSEEVIASVDRSKSWVKDTVKASLAHEQLHFDLAELYARMTRESLTQLKERGAERRSELVTKIAQEYQAQLQGEQMRYDDETRHGQDAVKQEEWRIDVQKRLKQYAFFKN